MLDGFPTRAAWALCTIAYSAGPGTEPVLFEGRTDGQIVPPRGLPNLKFGWGPVFEADETGLTYVNVRALMLMPHSPWAPVAVAESGAGTDAMNFAATRRWRRRRKTRFLTGHARCKSCARTY